MSKEGGHGLAYLRMKYEWIEVKAIQMTSFSSRVTSGMKCHSIDAKDGQDKEKEAEKWSYASSELKALVSDYEMELEKRVWMGTQVAQLAGQMRKWNRLLMHRWRLGGLVAKYWGDFEMSFKHGKDFWFWNQFKVLI